MVKVITDYKVNDLLEFKKNHPCGGKIWKVVKYGVDCKLECMTCHHLIILPRLDISKKIKKIIKSEQNDS